MKKQGQFRTLKLNRETLRHLESQELSHMLGGESLSCLQTCQHTCLHSCIQYNTCFCPATTAC
jgi:hypothetical protein